MKRPGKMALLALLLPWSSVAAAQSVMGDWLTDDKSAIIRVASCGEKLCGTILRVLNPAAPAQDINNPDPAKKHRPLVGVAVLSGFSPTAKGWGGGIAYDPKVGKSYKSSLALAGARTLNVTGCVLFLCRTKRWSRVEDTRIR